jgi:hypothetical protein
MMTAPPSPKEPLMYVNLFGLLCGIQLNIWLRRCLERLVTPARLAVFVCAVMPAGAVAMVLQAVGRVRCVWSFGTALPENIKFFHSSSSESSAGIILQTHRGSMRAVPVFCPTSLCAISGTAHRWQPTTELKQPGPPAYRYSCRTRRWWR